MNLAEDVHIEKKMSNRQLPVFLVGLLDRSMEELLFVALTFLKKLSIFEENKQIMAEADIVPKLLQLAQHQSAYIALAALRVLYNLSFDEQVRSSLAESGELFQKLVDLLRHPPFRQIVLKLLYQFTRDDRCKSLLTYHPDCLVMLLQLIVHFPDTKVGKDLVALCINLALHPRAAELMVIAQLKGKEGHSEFLFPQVVLRIIRTRDVLLSRVLRYCVSHDNVRDKVMRLLASDQVRMSKWVNELVKISVQTVDQGGDNGQDLLVELIGTLANLTDEGVVPWAQLCDFGLIDLLHRLLVVGFSEDDLVLECIMVVGLIAREQEGAQLLALQSKFLLVLQELLAEKQEDDEIVLQLLYTFHCLVIHEETREIILEDSRLTSYIMDLMRDKNPAIRKQASATLQAIADLESAKAREEELNNMNNLNGQNGNNKNQDEQKRGVEGLDTSFGVNPDGTIANNLNSSGLDVSGFGEEGGRKNWVEHIKMLKFEIHNSAWCHELRQEEAGKNSGDFGDGNNFGSGDFGNAYGSGDFGRGVMGDNSPNNFTNFGDMN